MLKNKTKLIALLLVLVLFFSTTISLAYNETTDDEIMQISEESNVNDNAQSSTTSITEDTYKKSDVYLAGDNITIDYIVDGNAFICADTVTISSQIGGDAFIMAKNLIIEEEGYIYSSLFAIADSIEIKGIAYDIYSLSKTLTISNGYIYRDVKASCNTLNINAPIGRNVFTNCSNINFNTTENSTGTIYGNLNYSSDVELSIPENTVYGEIIYSQISSEDTIGEIIAEHILDLGSLLAFVIIIWLLCLWLAPKFLNNTNQFVGKKTLEVFGFGLLTLVIIPVVSIILMILYLTTKLSFVLLAIYFLALIISTSLFIITVNNYICSKLNIHKNLGVFGVLILSTIVIWLLTLIPYIGTLISFVIVVLGLGILAKSIIPKRISKNEEI